jgi:MFS family permease
MNSSASASWRRPVIWAAIPFFLGAGSSADAIGVALPNIRDEHDVHLHHLLWVVLAFVLAQAVVLIAAGRVGDRVGRRPVFMAGLAIVALGSLAAAAAPGHGWLVAARIIEGLGAGILISGTFAIVRDAVPVEVLGRAFGLYGLVAGIALLILPVSSGALTHFGSWRWVLALNAVICLVALVLTPRFLPDGSPSTTVQPSIPRLLRSENFISASALAGLMYLIVSMMWFTLTFYLHTVHGSTALEIGLVFASYGIVRAALPPYAGKLADRIGVRSPLLIGWSLIFCAMVAFSFAADANHLPATMAILAVAGLGVAFIAPASNAAALAQIHVEDRSDASGLYLTVRMIGIGIGVAIAAIMLATISGTTKPEFGIIDGQDEAAVAIWIVGAVISLIALVITATGIKTADRNAHQASGAMAEQQS